MTETHDTETEGQTEEITAGRRAAIASVVSAVGLAGLTGQVSAQSGKVGTNSNPYNTAFVTIVDFEARTSDPSSPNNGTMWYRGDV